MCSVEILNESPFQAIFSVCVIIHRHSAKSMATPHLNDNTTTLAPETNATSPDSDANAEMLIAIPDRIPSPYLVPPPFPPPFSVLIRRKTPIQAASRRYYQDPKPFVYPRNQGRIPVNSIQDILNQMEMERESGEFERIAQKRPKRINFYGRYKHRPNRPKVIPIQYGNSGVNEAPFSPPLQPPPMRDNNPSVANDVNHLITPKPVPQRDQSQLYYPNPTISHSSAQTNGLYEQIIATNKLRQETAKDAKPFSLMLDIYPMQEDNRTKPTTTVPPPLPPPQLPPLQIDHSYYDSMKFPQIHPTLNTIHHEYHAPIRNEPQNEQPEKMVVHLNLYPTKKKNTKYAQQTADPMIFFNDQNDEVFMPIVNPQIYYRSRSSEDEENLPAIRGTQNKGEIVDIPRRNYKRPATGVPRVNRIPVVSLGPPINITDYRTTIAPQTINTFLYGEGPPRYTYLGQFQSNEIGRRIDHELIVSTTKPELSASTKTPMSNNYQRNSHQPENPMVVENFSLYSRSAISEQPSRKAISS